MLFNASYTTILNTAIADVTSVLTAFAADSLFVEKFALAFGTKISARQFLQTVAALPQIEVRSDAELKGALGAFSAQTQKIYLSESLLKGDLVRLRSVLIEEIGHFVDAQVNSVDSPGDEGAIFAAVVLGQKLSSSQLAQLRAEDDHGIINLNGQNIAVEKATTNEPYLVADINQNSVGSNPSNFIKVGGVLYFTANDDINGTELWKTDPTTGVVTLLEINPGTGNSNISNLTDVNGTLYFRASDNTNGTELWKVGSNGTPTRIDLGSGSSSPNYLTNVNGTLYFTATGYNGTTSVGNELWKIDPTTGNPRVIDIVSGSGSSSPRNLINANGVLYFVASNSTSGNELWKLDPTTGSPIFLKDIYAGSSSSNPSNLTYSNGKLYFTADNYTQGTELWQTDGTTEGTVLTQDINKITNSSSPSNFIKVGGVLYFTANDEINGTELWKTDPTTGVVTLLEINSGSSSSSISNLTDVNGTLYFRASDDTNGTELWKIGTNGTPTRIDLGSGSSSPNYLTNVNGTLYFTATGYNGPTSVGQELWRIDPTTGNAVVIDIVSGSGSSDPSNLTNTNGILYFQAYTPATGYELWKVDPANNLPVLISDLSPGTGSSSPTNFINSGGTVYFIGNNGANGSELFRLDPTTGNPVLLDIRVGANGSSPTGLIDVNGTLYFKANDGINGTQLWKIDPTTGTPVRLVVPNLYQNNAGYLDNFTKVGNKLYFRDSYYRNLYVIDSTTGNPVTVSGISVVQSLTNINGVLYFQAYSGTTGYELWKIDPTTGTPSVIDINSGTGSSSPTNFTDVNGTLFFTASNSANGYELWKLDGTGNPVLVKDILTGTTGSSPSNLFNVNGTLYFTADNGINGVELWKSDGTTAGTVLAKDINGRTPGSSTTDLIDVNGTLYFKANDGINGNQLWKIDPTTGTPVRLVVPNLYQNNAGYLDNFTKVGNKLYFRDSYYRNLYAIDSTTGNPVTVSGISVVQSLTNINGVLYFQAYSGTTGYELWKIDPTTGTPSVIDIVSGTDSSSPTNFTDFNGTLFFTAFNSANGYELWKLDSTGNPVLVKDIYTGTGSSSPSNLFNVNGTLYFTANNSINGVELWKSDGTTAGTVLAKDINGRSPGSYPTNLIDVNGTLYFIANDGITGNQLYDNQLLWKIDPTTGTPVRLVVPNLSAKNTYYVDSFTKAGNKLYFRNSYYADYGRNQLLYTIDSTTGNPVVVGGISSLSVDRLTNINGVLYFQASSGTTGTELWKIDPTTGTPSVIDIVSRTGGSSLENLTDVNGTLFFTASINRYKKGLWKLDSTGNPVLLKDIYQGGIFSPSNLSNVNGTLYFTADNGINGVELWKSDGTTAGTVQLEISAGSAGSYPTYLTNVNGTLYFQASTDGSGYKLWKIGSNGTPIQIDRGSLISSPNYLTNVNGTLYFTATGYNGTTSVGNELWKIGPTEGTPSVIDIVAGSGSSSPHNLINANGVLYFVASNSTSGRELWKLDPTTGSPILLKDIYVGSSNSNPSNLTYSNGKLYFTADNGTQGYELWAVNVNVTTVGNITKNSNEDQTVSFTATDFSSVFVSGSGSPLAKVKILLLSSNGVLKLGTDAVTANQEIAVADLGSLTFVPNTNFNGTAGFTWNGSDGTTFATDPSTVTLTINSINDVPTVANPIADVSIYSDRASNFGFSANTFQDADLEDTLSYSATLADGSPLPSWLSLNGDRTFSSNPGSADAGQYEIKVTAKDQSNVTVTDNFILKVLNSAPTNIYLSNNTIPENSADNTPITTLSSEDYNTNNTHTYILINDAGGRFKLNGNQLVVANTSLLDYEATTQHTIRIKTTDSTGLTYERDLVIYLSNVNDSFAGTLSFTSSTFSVNENGTAIAAVTIQRTGGSEGTVSANIALSNGTATYPNDYSTTSVNVLFANGETSKIVSIPIFDDNLFEGDETLNLTLLDPTGGSNLGTQTTAVLTIVDSDNVPDLIVSNITAPVEVISGQPLEISWTVKNQGVNAATGTWYDYVYLQNQNGGQNYNIGTFEFVGALAVGESVNRSQTITLPIQLQGNYKVVVITDSSNSIREEIQNESNNTTTDDRLLQVKLAPIPNLQVSSVTAPLTAFSSQSTAIQWTVKNVGNGATSSPYWSDSVYLSLDNIFDNTDIYLGQANNPSYLNAGDSYNNNLDVTLPRGISGNYYFLVKTDVNNNVFENDQENDNLTVGGPTNVSLTPPPDFQVTNVTTPSQAFSGQSLNLNWTVTNKGLGKNLETAWYDQVFISTDDVLDAGDRNLGTFYQNRILNSDGSYTSSQTVSLPIGISGDYYFFVVTDAGNQVYENVFDGNNTGHKTTPTRINLTPPPDLEIAALTAPTQATASRALNFSYQVTNFGSTITPNYYWIDRFYLSVDNQLDLNTDLRIGDQYHYGSLAPNGSYISNFSYILPNTLTGNYYLFGITDSNNEVFELDNGNNTFLVATPIVITSRPADLVVASVSAPTKGEAGKALRVEWTVRNQGTGDTAVSNWTDWVILSKDALVGNSDDIVLGSFSRGEILAPNQSYTRSELVTLPIDAIAGYQVFVVTDVGNSVYEATQENNNSSTGQSLTVTREIADLQVTQVSSPSSGQSGQALTVNWTVKNFGSRTTNSNYWYDGVYLSTDNQISNDDILLGYAYRSEALGASEQYSVARSFNLPNNLQAGNYYTLVRADALNYVYEGSLENNNDKATEGTTTGTTGGTSVGVTASPDLVIVSVDAPTTGISGQNLAVSWTVRNAGTVATSDRSWYEAFYLSRDQVFDRNSDTYLGHSYYTGNLAAGATYSKTESFRLPQGISGPFYLFAQTDSGNWLYEGTAENNNVAYDPNSVEVSLAQPADLVVGTITIPANGVTGKNSSITYTVTNEGSNAVVGNWSDSLYLSKDGQWDINDLFLGQVDNSREVLSGDSYTNTLTASLPGLVPGDYQVIIRSDIRNQIPESNENNNLKATLDKVNVDVERLTLGTPSTGTLAQGQGVYYRFDVGAGETLRLKLDSVSTEAANELYLRYGEMPTRSAFDLGFSEALSPDQEIVIPATRGGTYYVLAYGGNVPTVANYTLEADLLDFSISALGTSKGSNKGQTTVKISGAKFTSDDVVSLIATDGTQRQASKVWWKDSTELWATFDLQGLTTGAYDVRVNNNTKIAVLNDSFTVTSGAVGHLETQLNLPSALRAGRVGIATISYANTGETDLISPLLILSVTNANLKLADGSLRNNYQFLAVGSEGAAGILSPGEQGSFSVVFNPTVGTGSSVQFGLSSLTQSNQTLDWSSIKDNSRPSFISQEAWEGIWSNFVASVGQTPQEYVAALADNANTFSQQGKIITDVSQLIAAEIQQAESTLLGNTLTSIVDASSSSPGLDLVFARSFQSSFDGRLTLGKLGYGWTSNWDISATADAQGTVTIQESGTFRLFERQTDGSYKGQARDYATLSLVGNSYQLRETDGSILAFRVNGKLDYLEDTNRNRITAGYTNENLTSLTHTNGSNLTLAYNNQGRITQLTDAAGQIITYGYDQTGEHLLSVTDGQGTVSYSYDGDSSLALKNTLRSITLPDGTVTGFSYDSQGRLTQKSLNGTAQVSYSYDSSTGITVTDSTGATSELLLNDLGQIGHSQNPLGGRTQYKYDQQGNLIQQTAPDGTTSSFSYDSQGNLVKDVDALGQKVEFTYDSQFNNLTSLKDQRGNPLTYGYDTKGNLTSITYADGSSETSTVDSQGNITASVNRSGQTIQYTYNNQGLLTRKSYADGSSATYTYDSRGNLLSAIDADSSVTYTYDTANRLTKVTEGNGRFLQYSYDAVGRRSRLVDQNGFTTNYSYDSKGQLARLSDGNNVTIVTYTYDTQGRLVREDNGNGTYTTYSYDSAGQLLHLVNYAANATVNSRFDYTYDSVGRRTSVTTLEGTTNYGYDAIGQLTSVTLPDARTIEYRYDAAGNRVSVKDSGATTNYSTNNLNEYTSVGNATYNYDANGNLISKTQNGVTSSYSYDVENRLIAVTTPDGTWSYEYDALGNRTASIHNGQRTSYLLDPTGLVDVVGEYDNSGNLVANYTQGLGLVSRVDGTNTASYYDSDAIGSTVGLTGATGSYLNSYSYLPFGEDLTKVESVSNPFEYVGQWGVMDEGNGLDFMRARFYNLSTGKFLTTDPLGIGGGDTNLYRYTFNNPVSYSDPSGLHRFDKLFGYVGKEYKKFWDWYHKQQKKKGWKDIDSQEEADGSVQEWKDLGRPRGDNKGKWRRDSGLIDVALLFIPWQIAIPWAVGYAIGTWINNNYRDYFDPLFDEITRIINPSDPNDIVGPTGFGEEKWTSASSTLPYTIRFENQSTATAPAQTVTITHPLDTDLDLRTFRLGSFGWGGLIFDVPANTAFYNQRLDLTATRGYFVDVTAGIDLVKGEAFWTITTIDPNTGEVTTDALTGFLPPNNGDGIGDGFVNYTIKAKRNVTTGTVIDAKATIIFDTEAPIDTPPIFNTLDAGKPTSTVKALPANVTNPEFVVNWTGNDGNNGSALANYTIYVSDNNGEFTPWLTDTTLTEATYIGQTGHTYAFYSIAKDNAGNTQTLPDTAQATIIVGTLNTAPTITSGLTANFAENGTGIAYTIIASDPEGTTLTYGLLDSDADASLFNINSTTGAITFKTAPDFETPLDNGANNTYNLTVTANDGSLTSSKAIAITVTNLNEIKGNSLINNGRNPIVGTAGPDYLTGGAGAKTLTGGGGNDSFVFTNMRDVGQRIADFTVGEDKLVFTQLFSSLGYKGSNPIADSYIKFVQGTGANSAHTFLQIDRDGLTGSAIARNFLQVDNITPTQLNNINNFQF